MGRAIATESMKGVLGFVAAKLKRADEEGKVAPALVFSLTLVALLPAVQSALAVLGRTAPVRLRVLMEGFPEHLTVYVSVYNLTERGAVRVARASGLASALPPDGLIFDFAVRKVPLGVTEIRGVKKVRYEIYPFNVFAYAYDARRRELYAASAHVTVSPEQYEYVVELKARKLHSTQVSADQVPSPGQYEQILDLSADNVIIVACSVPDGASCYAKIPAGMNVPIETFERMYWTDDPTLQTWTDEGWSSTGYVGYTTDGGCGPGYFGGSIYNYPTNVDYVVSTVGESPPPLYIVRVLRYPKNINHNTFIAGAFWTPCSGGTFVTQIPRSDTRLYYWQKYTGFRPHLKEITITFVTVTGKKIPIPLPSPHIEIEPQYIELGVKVDDWSKAPSNANYLKVYSCSGDNMWVRAQYEP
jgi:hypothetical protein